MWDNSSAMSMSISPPDTSTYSLQFYIVMAAGALLSLLTILGNGMVFVSYKMDRELQTVSNYFLLSLAFADFFIGVISIPFMTYYTALGSWPLGYGACQFWLCMDYLMSNASVMNLLLISMDRYFSVTSPLTYRPRRTRTKALMMISSTFIVSALLWPPWIVAWPYIEGRFTVDDSSCYIQFLETSPYITVVTAFCAFYIPVTVMFILYVRVLGVARKRHRVFGTLSHAPSSKTPHGSIKTGGEESVNERRDKARKKREGKAIRTLLAIMLAFIITWLPYDLIVLWEIFYPHTTPGWAWSAAYALCYVNSTVNPICYALGNPKYRETYIRILTGRWTSNRVNMQRRSTVEVKI